MLYCKVIFIIIIIIIHEFHRDTVLNKTSGPLCVTYYTNVNATVADSLRCRNMVEWSWWDSSII